ncbi:MAG: TolC family protein [Verrucomicrobia bacterium]|nr:TolC family protein [Verrucomicrobiota bacterium]
MRQFVPASCGSAIIIGTALFACGCQLYRPAPLADSAPIINQAEPATWAPEPRLATNHWGVDTRDGISLPEAEQVALVYNPDLRLLRLQAGISRARADFAGRWSEPVFQVDVLRSTDSADDPWIVSPSLAITVPVSGRLDAARETAQAIHRVDQARIREAEWNVRRQVRRAWITWSTRKMKIEATVNLVTELEGLVDSTHALAEAGEMVRTEATLFSIERVQRQTQMRLWRVDLADEELSIRSLLGLTPDADLQFVPLSELGLNAERFAPIVGDPGEHPTIVRVRDEYGVADKMLHEEVRAQSPDLTVGPIVESDRGESLIGLSLAVELPVLNRNRQGIAAADASRHHARAVVDAAYERQTAARARARARLAALVTQHGEIEKQFLPLVEKQYADALELLKLGEGSGLVLLESLVRAHEARLQLIDLEQDIMITRILLVDLTGPEGVAMPSGPPAIEE